MEQMNHALEPSQWAGIHFGDAPLSDVRRVQRLQMIGEAMAANPGASIPQLFARPYDVKAAYHFFDHPEVTPESVQSAHRAWVMEQLERAGTYLLIEDTTELDWTDRAPIPGLGPIGNSNEGTQGVRLHSVVAARWDAEATVHKLGHRPSVELLGLASQEYLRRIPRPVDDSPDDSLARKKRERESLRWLRSGEELGLVPRGVRWVRVGDAEADIYEYVQSGQSKGHGYVIRAGQNRALVAGDGRTVVGHLYETVRHAPTLGQFAVNLYPRPGQAARTVELSVSAVAVCLRAPQRPGASAGKLPPIACTAVRVWEAAPPSGVEPLEWILLCDVPVTTFAQAHECALQYASRWLVEDFHKALKTGLGVERLQLETAGRLFAAAALMSVVALRLVGLREQVRRQPQRPAEEAGLDELTLEVLRSTAHRSIQTVEDVALAIGRLGGHLNRRQDGLPGWQTLWRGMQKLELLVEGVRLSCKLPRFG